VCFGCEMSVPTRRPAVQLCGTSVRLQILRVAGARHLRTYKVWEGVVHSHDTHSAVLPALPANLRITGSQCLAKRLNGKSSIRVALERVPVKRNQLCCVPGPMPMKESSSVTSNGYHILLR